MVSINDKKTELDAAKKRLREDLARRGQKIENSIAAQKKSIIQSIEAERQAQRNEEKKKIEANKKFAEEMKEELKRNLAKKR